MKLITALCMLALFAGHAQAQTPAAADAPEKAGKMPPGPGGAPAAAPAAPDEPETPACTSAREALAQAQKSLAEAEDKLRNTERAAEDARRRAEDARESLTEWERTRAGASDPGEATRAMRGIRTARERLAAAEAALAAHEAAQPAFRDAQRAHQKAEAKMLTACRVREAPVKRGRVP